MLRYAALGCLVLYLCVGCRDSTSPDHYRIVAGDVVDGTVSAGSPAIYRVDVKANQQLAIYLEVAGPRLKMSLFNDAGVRIAVTVGENDPPAALRHSVVTPLSANDAEYSLRVDTSLNSPGGSFHLRAIAIDRRPETGSATVTLGTIVEGAIDHPADVDEYTFTVTQGQEVEIYLQRLALGITDFNLIARLESDGGVTPFFGLVSGAPVDGDLEQTASGTSALAPGTYHLIVQSNFVPETGYVGPYRFQLRPIVHAPEHGPATLVAGDSLTSERIDYVGDVDDFVLSGAPGDEFNVFIDASGTTPHGVIAGIPNNFNFDISAGPGGPPLLQNATGRMTIPASGSLTIRVRDLRDAGGLYRGPYRIFAARLQRAPEGAPPTAVVGAPPISGQIDLPGDIDEYTINVTTPSTLNFLLTRPSSGTGSVLQATLLKGATGNEYVQYDAILSATTSAVASSRHVVLQPGTYRVRVQGESSRGTGYVGGYTFELRAVREQPESIGARIAFGDTIRGESLEYSGDIDTFVLSVAATDTFHVRLDTPGQPNPGITLWLLDPVTGHVVAGLEGDDANPQRSYVETGRLALEPGDYRVAVFSWSEGEIPTQQGAFELVAERVSARPEHRPAALALGDTIRIEPIDYLGDYDDFIVHGAPGDEIGATFLWGSDPLAPCCPGSGTLAILDSATGAILGGTQSAGYPQSSHRVAFPANGVLRIRIQAIGSRTGGYWFVAQGVNRAPEGRVALFTLGDTVSEVLHPSIDVDEYTFDGSAGQSVDMFFQAPNGILNFFGAFQLDLIDLSTGTTLGTLTTNNYTANLEDIARRGIVLPRTGTYRLRVQGAGDFDGEGNYRFRVAPSP